MNSIRMSSVEGNRQKLDGGSMFGNAPKALWEKWFTPDNHNRIELACRAMLIEVNGRRILCETGIGAFFAPDMATRFGVADSNQHKLLDSLLALGFQEDDIDVVILSHLHFDHAGGLMPTWEEKQQGRTELHFPNARYVVGAEAWERAQHPHARDRASFIPELPQALMDSKRLDVVPVAAQNLASLPQEISFLYSQGHTVGHMHTLVTAAQTKVLFCGDLIPGQAWLSTAMTMGYDRFPEGVVDEKTELYRTAIREQWWLFYTHDPLYTASQVVYDSRGKVNAQNSVHQWQQHLLS
jgi:glyoxylase-like metal-dependent hydrolase (beta-lactamase superfamily II)